MADIEAMAIREPSYQLAKYPDGFLLMETTMIRDVVKELASLNIFKNEIPVDVSDLQ